ncbi:hypothetical protein HPB47_019802 [Ixodes persulcatus]|uniref:Uncharacterized protein n=1 Tax=Ixodes persulcatus TaxID=34615 RepID=A0AC60QKQ6_IXOPE|nr:hypothetical protein HPB47_019802 [Ixodes persulcatus]
MFIQIETGRVVIEPGIPGFCCAVFRSTGSYSWYYRDYQRAPDPDDDGYGDWVSNHKFPRNIDCNAERMEAKAALILFKS